MIPERWLGNQIHSQWLDQTAVPNSLGRSAGQSRRAGSCGCLRPQPGISAGNPEEPSVSLWTVGRSVHTWLVHGHGHPGLTTNRSWWEIERQACSTFGKRQVCFNAFPEVLSRFWLVFQLSQLHICVWNQSIYILQCCLTSSSTLEDVTEKTKPGSYHCKIAGWQETTDISWKKKLFRHEDNEIVGCPERLSCLHLWKFLGRNWIKPWATYSNLITEPSLSRRLD